MPNDGLLFSCGPLRHPAECGFHVERCRTPQVARAGDVVYLRRCETGFLIATGPLAGCAHSGPLPSRWLLLVIARWLAAILCRRFT